jgi:hypothetical protein
MHSIGAIRVLAYLGCFGLLPLQLATLVMAKVQVHACTAMEQRQAHGPIMLSKAEDACIVLDTGRRKRLNRALRCMGRFPVHRDTANGLNRQIRRQLKAAAHLVVEHRLHTVFVADVGRQGVVDIRTCIRKA